ncbi:hypothetical protein JW992_03805 [candidate division KSB1 bacterium]|nr:hypothetical protein [candidate division KSB1 bacterium]
MITDPKNFRNWLLTSAREEAERHFDPDQLLCIIPRETAWYAICLLESGQESDRDLADAILTKIRVNDGTHSPCTLDLIERAYGHKLGTAARENILDNLRNNLAASALARYSDGNVNHPIAAYVNLVLSGERFGLPAYVELGRGLLRAFHETIANRRHLVYRQTEMAEYNSPTYTALTLWFLALAAEYVRDPKIRRQALVLEQQLWVNVALHWHVPTQQFAGPFSRAYAEDSYGGFSGLHCTFAQAFECPIFLDPDLPRRFEHPSALIQNAMIAATPFHVPAAAHHLAFEKPMPLVLRCTTYGESYHENSRRTRDDGRVAAFDDELYPGGWSELTTYLHPDFTLASASRPYVNAAQSDALVLRLRRGSAVHSTADFRTLTTRLVLNGGKPGQENFCHTAGFVVGSDYLYEEGRTLIYQHENRALQIVTPKRPGHCGVSQVRMELIWSHATEFDGLWIDGRPAQGETRVDCLPRSLVWIDGPVAIVVMPLFIQTLAGQTAAVEFRQDGMFWICSFSLYVGKERDFTRDELAAAGLGVGYWLVPLAEMTRRGLFSRLAAGQVDHSKQENGSERIDWVLDGGRMEFVYNRISERIEVQRWNGIDDRECAFSIQSPAAQTAELPDYFYRTD